MAPGTSAARAGSQLHFTYGFGNCAACSEYRKGSNGNMETRLLAGGDHQRSLVLVGSKYAAEGMTDTDRPSAG